MPNVELIEMVADHSQYDAFHCEAQYAEQNALFELDADHHQW